MEEEDGPANDDDSTDEEGTDFDASIAADSSTEAIESNVNVVSSTNDDSGVVFDGYGYDADEGAGLEVEVDTDAMSFSNDDSGADGDEGDELTSVTKSVQWKADTDLVEYHFIKSRRDMSVAEKADLWYPLEFIDDGEEVEEDDSFAIDDEDWSIGTLSDLDDADLDVDFACDNGGAELAVDEIDAASFSNDDSGAEEEESGGCSDEGDQLAVENVDAVASSNDESGVEEDESGGCDGGGAELAEDEEFKKLNLFGKFDAIEDEAKTVSGSTSFGSIMVDVNGRSVRRSRRKG